MITVALDIEMIKFNHRGLFEDIKEDIEKGVKSIAEL